MSMNDMNNPILSYFFFFLSSFYCRFSIVQNGSVFRIFHVEHTDIIIVYRGKNQFFPSVIVHEVRRISFEYQRLRYSA